MGISKRMVQAELEYLKHLAADGRELEARGLAALVQGCAVSVTGVPFASLADIVTAINGANGGAGIPNVTASTSAGKIVLTTNATGTTEAITVKATGTANSALGFSTTSDTTGTGTSAPAAGVVQGTAITAPIQLYGLTLLYTSTHSSTPTSGTIVFAGDGGVIVINGQMTDGLGNSVVGIQDVVLKTNSVTGATMAANSPAVGVIKTGSASAEVWMQTNSSGAFSVLATDSTEGELALLIVFMPDGQVVMAELQY